jgi:hypothetical protein
MNRRILNHFGISQKGFYISELFKVYANDILNAIMDNQLTAIVGQFGSGKSELYKYAVRKMKDSANIPILCRVMNSDKEKLRIGHVQSAIIRDMGESPRQDLEARSIQVVRLVGERHVVDRRYISVVIENAHRLHQMTLMAIKDMREEDFAGHSPLMSVIMIGQNELKDKLARKKEVFWRTNLIELTTDKGWYNFDDRVNYLEDVFGIAINQAGREKIASLCEVPLQMDWLVEIKMNELYQAGINQITESCFELTPIEMLESLNHELNEKDPAYISYSKIAKTAGVSRSSVGDVLSGRRDHSMPAVARAIEKLAYERGQQNESKPFRKVG